MIQYTSCLKRNATETGVMCAEIGDLCKNAASTANIQEGKILERLSLYWVNPAYISHAMHTKAAGDQTSNSTAHVTVQRAGALTCRKDTGRLARICIAQGSWHVEA